MIDQATVEKTEFYKDLLLCHGMEYMSLLLWSFSRPA